MRTSIRDIGAVFDHTLRSDGLGRVESWLGSVRHEANPGDVIEDARRYARDMMAGIVGNDPIPMRLTCPLCGELHIDEGDFATKPHHTHACQHCGNVWRPAIVDTVGVQFLPGFKNEAP